MGTFFKIAGAICAVIFILMILIGCLNCCQNASHIDDMEDTVAIRYYLSDGDDAPVRYMRVEKGKGFEITTLPSSDGKTFVGLYTSDNPDTGMIIVGADGKSVVRADADMILYPVFVD